MDDGYSYGKVGSLIELDFKESKSVTLKINGPRHARMRMVVGVSTPDDTIQNKVYSAYFTTR